jgi:hypothetical protein
VFEATPIEEEESKITERNGRRLVIKICSLEDDANLLAFKNEKAIMAKLPPSKYVPKMIDYHENMLKACLVLENAGELTLEKFVKQQNGAVRLK